MDSADINKQLEKLQRRIKYNSDIWAKKPDYDAALKDLLEDSMYIGLSILYPFEDFSEKKFPKKYYNWQIRCCVELYSLAGRENLASYSENGLAWTMFKSGLSVDLLNELTPRVGVPKRISESESDTNV